MGTMRYRDRDGEEVQVRCIGASDISKKFIRDRRPRETTFEISSSVDLVEIGQ